MFFWLAQLALISSYTLCTFYDIHYCSKVWNRSLNVALYLLFIVTTLFVYRRWETSAQESAFLEYHKHKSFFNRVVVTTVLVLASRATLSVFNICLSDITVVFQITYVLQDTLVVVPVLLYCYFVSRDEDCLTCFNRHRNILFSFYQVRKDNSIEKLTLLGAA